VAYSPLGRGFLSGRFKSPDELDPDDFRRHGPRFRGENLEPNLALVAKVEQIAGEKGITPGQLAPGCLRRATTWSRSPAPSGVATSRRTSAPVLGRELDLDARYEDNQPLNA
jgi:aryl-alcohol dehydrogenase-like predicted oxidoreductase